MIRFEDVNKVYFGKKTALQGIRFHLPKGSFTYLTGHSGAGKSTLLKLIMAMERANGGRILFDNYDITRLSHHDIPFLRRQIGMVHQEYRLLDNQTVLDNVALPLIIAGVAAKEAYKQATTCLEQVGLAEYGEIFPPQLSGGEKQRVDIARAIVHRPKILLADEPTGNLDAKLSLEIFELLARCNTLGMTVLIATHDLHLLKHRPAPCLTLKNGHLVS